MNSQNRFNDDFNKIFKPVTQEKLAEIQEYQRGVNDCINGVIHNSKSVAYDEGYSDQYAFEQIQNSKEIR